MTAQSFPDLPGASQAEAMKVVAWISQRNIRYLAELARKSVSVFPYQDAEDEVPLVRLSDVQALAGEVERLRADVEALTADAERYRWLRDVSEWEMFEDSWLTKNDIYGQGPADMDTVIDSARVGEGVPK